MICSKCSVDKPESEYSTYYHGTQKKWRQRKICKICFNEQKSFYRESIRKEKIIQPVEDMYPTEVIIPPIDYSNNPDYKICIKCNEFKPLEEFHFSKRSKSQRFNSCKECEKITDKLYLEERKKKNGGSKMVPHQPNTYFDEYQRQNTFELMTLLGYLFNEEYQTWTKEGVISIKDGKPYFHFLKYHPKKCGRGSNLSQTQIEKVMEYRSKNYPVRKIQRLTTLSESTIYKIFKQYENR